MGREHDTAQRFVTRRQKSSARGRWFNASRVHQFNKCIRETPQPVVFLGIRRLDRIRAESEGPRSRKQPVPGSKRAPPVTVPTKRVQAISSAIRFSPPQCICPVQPGDDSADGGIAVTLTARGRNGVSSSHNADVARRRRATPRGCACGPRHCRARRQSAPGRRSSRSCRGAAR